MAATSADAPPPPGAGSLEARTVTNSRQDLVNDENRLTNKTASKWDGVKEKWMPYFRMSYQYTDNEITLSYARWNEKHQSYDKDMSKSVYEMNAENMPVAYKSNSIYHTVNLLTMTE